VSSTKKMVDRSSITKIAVNSEMNKEARPFLLLISSFIIILTRHLL